MELVTCTAAWIVWATCSINRLFCYVSAVTNKI